MSRKKTELQMLSITNSKEQEGSFVLLLGEIGSRRKLPITISAPEAQALTMEFKGINPSRPLTHALFNSVIEALGSKLLQILIYKVDDYLFYSYLYLKTEETILRIDSRTSDAVTLALRTDVPILVYEDILEAECLKTEEESVSDSKVVSRKPAQLQDSTLEQLKKVLQKAVSEEDYERAAQLRDQIERKSKI